MLELIKSLCSANAPSGCEDEAIRLITHRLDELNVRYTRYPSGNVIASLPAENENAPRIMVQCHVDEVGFMVKGHRDGGYLSLAPLGISDTAELVGKRVTMLADGAVHGAIGAVPIHLSKDKDKPHMDDLYADVGATDKEDSSEKIPLGTFGCFDTEAEAFGKDCEFISGKALSARIPCAVLLQVIERLKSAKLKSHLYFAFTVRGKLSLCGATEAYNKIRPDSVISVVGTPTLDLPDSDSPICLLGRGVAIPSREVRYVFDSSITSQLLKASEENGVSSQVSRPMTEEEDHDFDLLRMKNEGARLAVLRLPVRGIRSACEVASLSDAASAAELLRTALPQLEA